MPRYSMLHMLISTLIVFLSEQHYPVHPLDLFQFLEVLTTSPSGDNEFVYVCSATYRASTLNPATPVDYLSVTPSPGVCMHRTCFSVYVPSSGVFNIMYLMCDI